MTTTTHILPASLAPHVVTPAGHRLSSDAHSRLVEAVDATFGPDVPKECYTLALEFWDDEYRHAQMLRAIEGYTYPLNRDHITQRAVDAIEAC